MDNEVTCPFCGEPGEVALDIDENEPGAYELVQDCDVCCHPWRVRVVVGYEGEVTIDVGRE